MKLSQMKQTFILASLILIIGVLAFTGMLNISSFQEQYTTSLLNSQSVVAGETVRKIEFAVKYGKPLYNFHGIEELLAEISHQLPEIREVQVISVEGDLLYTLDSSEMIQKELYQQQVNFDESPDKAYLYILEDESYHQFLPVWDADGQWIGTIGLSFPRSVVRDSVRPYLLEQVRYLLLMTAFATLALIFINSKKSPISETGEINRKALLWTMVLVIGTAQVVYGVLNYQLFRDAYLDQTRENTSSVASIIEADIQRVLDKGVSYDQFYQMENYLANIANSLPEIDSIKIVQDDRILFGMDVEKSGALLGSYDRESAYRIPLPEPTEVFNGERSLQVSISQEYLGQRLRELLLDTLTVLAISTFFMVELTFFLLLYLSRKINREIPMEDEEPLLEDNPLEPSTQTSMETIIIRIMAFIVCTAIFMSSSFIPILMKSIYRPVMGLSESVVFGLPVSANFLLGAIGTLMAGRFIEQIGWRKTFFAGILVLGTGTFLSGLTGNPLVFILVRGITGAGYGLTLMSMRGFVLHHVADKDGGYASLNAGIYSGVNCGVVIGAMLADRISYRGVFFITVLVIVLAGVYVLFFTEKNQEPLSETITQGSGNQDSSSEAKKAITSKGFLSDSKVFLFFIGILLPAGICLMFLDYFFPLLTQELNVPVANVGRAFLINGLSIIYLGPVITRVLGKRLRVETLVALGAFNTAAAMIIFAIWGNLMAAFAAAFLLGIADSFALVAQTKYLLGLEATQRLGKGLALGYYSNIKKIGQMLGPVIIGAAITAGSQRGVGMVGIGALILATAFFMTIRKKQEGFR